MVRGNGVLAKHQSNEAYMNDPVAPANKIEGDDDDDMTYKNNTYVFSRCYILEFGGCL